MTLRMSNRSMDRRNFVRLSAAGAASAMIFGLAGCAPQSGASNETDAQSSFTPGTYTGIADGKHGPLTVETVFDETSITSVSVVEHGETRYISDRALSDIPASIVEYQSLGIDTITGCTLTSMAILQAAKDCVEQAGGDVKALERAGGPQKVDAVVEMDAELVVVGGGASGMAAAVAAAQSGATNVIVVEKTSNIGGNALVSGGFIHYIYAPDELRQPMTDGYEAYFDKLLERGLEAGVDQAFIDELRQEYEAYYASGKATVFDSENLLALDYHLTNGGSLENWQKYAPHVVDLDDWLTEMGFGWKKLAGIAGFPWPRWSASTTGNCGEGFYDLFNAQIDAEALPITVVTLTAAQELIMDGGAVSGVVGLCDDGTTYRISSERGVILATGGYSGNPDMLKEHNTYWDWDADTVIPTTNAYGHTGDGIVMATAAGANTAYMERPMVFPYADMKDYSTETIVGNTGDCLLVNAEGKRFVDESLDRYSVSKEIMKQTKGEVLIISDVNNCLIADGINPFGADEAFLLKNGQLYKGDSVADLAEQLGIEPVTLQETIDTYNRYAAQSKDDDFGRTVFTETAPVEQPPFYASPRTWAAHITLGGIVVDDDFKALDQQGNPIDGLYCVGELATERSGVHSMSTGLYAARSIFA